MLPPTYAFFHTSYLSNRFLRDHPALISRSKVPQIHPLLVAYTIRIEMVISSPLCEGEWMHSWICAIHISCAVSWEISRQWLVALLRLHRTV